VNRPAVAEATDGDKSIVTSEARENSSHRGAIAGRCALEIYFWIFLVAVSGGSL